MSITTLGLPKAINWERICVTEEMIEIEKCGLRVANAWDPSIAVYKYEVPADAVPDEAEFFENFKVTYLKVAVTLTPLIPTPLSSGASLLNPFVNYRSPGSWPSAPGLTTSFPSFGALLHVKVVPSDSTGLTALQYPYFSDFEPKKRELYEAVSETGQVASGSASRLSVGKSATSTESTENHEQAAAWNLGLSYGAEAKIGVTPQSYSKTISSNEKNDVQMSDSSTERRELQSHTTALSQMYSLFQSFHVGTNRAIFLLEPRPHVLSSAETFFQGPRALEGIQEVFLVVVQPTEPSYDLCVSVLLETAHIYDEQEIFPLAEYKKDRVKYDLVDSRIALWGQRRYTAPEGYTIYDWEVSLTDSEQFEWPTFTPSEKEILITFQDSNGGTKDGMHFELVVTLRREPNFRGKKKFFLRGRHLSCCADCETPSAEGITVTGDLPQAPSGPTQPPVAAANSISRNLRDAIISSLNSEDRIGVGVVPFIESEPFLQDVVRVLGNNPELQKPAVISSTLSPQIRSKLKLLLPAASVGEVLRMDVNKLSRYLALSTPEVLQIKSAALRSLRTEDKLHVNVTGRVTRVRVYSTSSSPEDVPIIDSQSPLVMSSVLEARQPNIVEIEFSEEPDSGTVTTSTVYLLKAGSAVSASVSQVSPTVFRLHYSAPLTAGLYTLVAKGSGTAVEFGGDPLDGDPIGLPSGDGVAGGDFEMAFTVIAPPLAPPTAPAPVTSLRVIASRALATTSMAILNEMVHPGVMMQLNSADNPGAIEVDFSIAPTPITVTTSTFLVSTPAGAVAGSLTGITGTRYRFTPTSAFATDVVHTVRLLGTGGTLISASGTALDGEPLRLPSGDGTAGGDFIFTFRINTPSGF